MEDARLGDQDQLALGEMRIDQRESHAVERQIPGGEPGIFPGVGHGHDVAGRKLADAAHGQMIPFRIAAVFARSRRRRLRRVALKPSTNIVAVELLAPQHARKGLPLNQPLIRIGEVRLQGGVERVRLGAPHREDGVAIGAPRRPVLRLQPHTDGPTLAAGNLQGVMRRRLGAAALRIDRRRFAPDDGVVDAVLEIAGRRGAVESPLIGFVVAEQQRRRAFADHAHRRQIGMADEDRLGAVGLQTGLDRNRGPRPDVSRPELRQDMQRRARGAAIMRRDPEQNVVGRDFRIFDLDVEIAVVVEDSGVDQLELALAESPCGVDRDESIVGKRGLRIFVEHPHIGMCRYAVEIVVEFLDVFAVIPFGVGQAEQALLQDRVPPVPQRDAHAEAQLVVGKSAEAVFAPAIGAASRMVVREIVPGGAVRAVVLAHGAPLPFAEIWPPPAPWGAGRRIGETMALLRVADAGGRRTRRLHRHRLRILRESRP